MFDKYEVNGKDLNTNSTSTNPDLWNEGDVSGGSFSSGIADATGPGGTTWSESSGKVTAVFKWIQWYPGDSGPPSVLCAKVTASADAYGPNADARLEVDNGIGGTVSTVPHNATYSTKTQNGTVYLQVETKGATLVKIPVSGVALKARAELNSSEKGGDVHVQVSMSAQPYNYWLRIECPTIEDSYKKGANGQPVKCERDAYGSIEVHSVAVPNALGQWEANHTFTAVEGTPSGGPYLWNFSTDWTDGVQYSGNQATARFKLGDAGPNKNTPPTTTVTPITVEAKGLISGYTVKWHMEVEGGVKGALPPGPANQGTRYDLTASSWVPVNTPITVTVKPASFALKTATTGGSLLTGLVAAGTALIWTSTGPAAPAAAVLLTAMSYGLASSAPQDITWTPTFDYDKYADAIRRQHAMNQGAAGTQEDTQRVFPPELADTAVNGLTDAGHAFDDPTWQTGNLKGNIAVARPWTLQPWSGDGYGAHGYTGIKQWNVDSEQTHGYVNRVTAPGQGY